MTTEVFESFFNNSILPVILQQSKTLNKKECQYIFNYFMKYRPSIMFEFGVEYGCSTKAFLEISKWNNINLNLHSWDITNKIKFVDKNDFNFHLDNISGREEFEFDKYHPELVFLDAHVYGLTRKIMEICVARKINFMCHDVSYDIGVVRAGQRSNGFTTGFDTFHVQWELYIMSQIFSKTLLEKNTFGYEDDRVKITLLRDMYGLAIVEVK